METGKSYVKSPAFQIYPADFLADANTLVMTAAEVGAYWLLICVCWRENGLPDDVRELAGLARTPFKQFQVSWDRHLKRCFMQREDGMWTHNRLQKERDKQIANREKRQEAGIKGADQRWQTDSKRIAMPSPKVDEGTTPTENGHGKTIASDSLSSSSSISSSTSTTSSEKKKERPAKKQQDERRTHPALVALRDVKGSYPTRDLWDSFIEKIGSHPNVPKLKECWLAWRTRNYAPNNYGWLVDWYFNGIPPANGSRAMSKVDASVAAGRSWVAKKEAEIERERNRA